MYVNVLFLLKKSAGFKILTRKIMRWVGLMMLTTLWHDELADKFITFKVVEGHKTVCLLSSVMQFLVKQDVVLGQITVTGISLNMRNERFHLTDRQEGGINLC